jgi:TM2 domain-containing membrane protein YozV
LLTGVGQFYNGDVKKGLLMLVCWVLGIFLTAGVLSFPLWIWSMIDAQRVAARTIPLWT